MAAAAVGYVGFALWAGWAEVTAALGRISGLGIVVALLCSLTNYGLRFVRWQMYLRQMGHAVPVAASGQIYVAGFALTITPGKAGELLRSVLLKPYGVAHTQTVAAFFSERLADLLAIILLVLFGLTLYPQAQPVVAVGLGMVLLALAMLIWPGWVALLRQKTQAAGKLNHLLKQILRMLRTARSCHRPAVLLPAFALGLLAWSAEAVATYWILWQMGLDIAFSFAVFAYALAVLAGALSFLPGGLGSTEAVLTALLVTQGIALPEALAATVIIRLSTLWFAVTLGGIAWLRQQPPASH